MCSRGHVKGVELAPTLACTLADNARELQSGIGSLRDLLPGGLDPGQESECGTGLFRVAPTKAGTGSRFQQADGQVVAPSTHDAHRSPWGNLGLQPGPLHG